MKLSDAVIIIQYVEESDYTPNAWERDFMDSVVLRDKDLTDKQEFCLNRIYERASGGGRYQQREHIRRLKKES